MGRVTSFLELELKTASPLCSTRPLTLPPWAPDSSSMPRAGNRAPPSLISFHQDCVGHTCIAWLLSSGPFQREGHLSWLSSPSYILCQVWAYFLSLLSLLSRMQNASSSVQNGKYQRKSQNYPSVPESDLLGPFFFSFFHSLLIRDSWFLTS